VEGRKERWTSVHANIPSAVGPCVMCGISDFRTSKGSFCQRERERETLIKQMVSISKDRDFAGGTISSFSI
jgi:hypothetical protein